MVKRLLAMAMFFIATVGASQAQQLQRDPARTIRPTSQRTAKGIRKAASLEGTQLFGYGNSGTWNGLGVGSTGVAFDVAIFLPGGVLTGATVQGVNLPVGDAGMTNVSVWARTELKGDNLAEGKTDGPFTVEEYLAVPFDEAVEIPASGIYVGYSFTCSVTYPIATDYEDEAVENSLFLQYKNGGWDDYSLDYGPSAMQVFLSNLSLPDYSITIKSVGNSTQLPGSEYTLPVNIVSNSAKDIQSLDIDVTIDGQTESKHIDLDTPVEPGLMKSGSFTIQGKVPATTGRFTADIKVTKVNDTDYEGEATGTASLKNVSKMVGRRTVIEEFTGTNCGWCPRGWVGMEYMKENYPEDFIGIAFHKYNSSDAMYYANYPMLGLSGAPGCVIDRKEQADPYYGSVEENYGIAQDFERLNQDIPEVDVTVEAQWNEAETSVDIDAEVEFLVAPTDLSLVYVLTADSLKGTTTAWKQANYYYQYTAEQAGNSPGISDFCKGGQYGKSSVALTFNDAVVGSSYTTTGVNQGQTVSEADGYTAGSTYTASYTVSGPTKATLKSALRKDLVTAIVLVVDNQTGEVLNAAKARVARPDAVRDVREAGQAARLSARYNAAGQVIAAPQRGINLVRMTDGSVRKVLVK